MQKMIAHDARHRSLRAAPTEREQAVMLSVTLWLMTGVFLDGWAHNHIPELETFFSPWHAVLYSGYGFTVLALLVIALLRKSRTSGTWSESVPLGYGWAFLGVLLFAVGGVGDLIWHELLGIEHGIEALLSPTHLLLAIGGFLMVTCNARVWFLGRRPAGMEKFSDQLPMLFSVASGVAVVGFMTQYSHFIAMRAGGMAPVERLIETQQASTITGYLLQSIVLVSASFIMIRHAKLARGACTFVFTVSTLAMALMLDGLILLPAALVTGIVADACASKMYPIELHHRMVRVFAFAIPFLFFILYFITIAFDRGVWWSVHLWSGAALLSGLSGLLASYLFLAPDHD